MEKNRKMKRKFLFLIFAFAASFSVFSQNSDSDVASKESKKQTNLYVPRLKTARSIFLQNPILERRLRFFLL